MSQGSDRLLGLPSRLIQLCFFVSGVAGLMYGFAQMTVDQTPWAMLAAPVALALTAAPVSTASVNVIAEYGGASETCCVVPDTEIAPA